MKIVRTPLFLFCLALLIPVKTSLAQPVPDNEDVQAIVDQLKVLSERARNERSADRWLLNSLDNLIGKYEWPWRNELLYEDFSDGDFTQEPVWQVISGQFWVDASLGLRSRTTAQPRDSVSRPERRKDEDVGRVLLDTLLRGVLETQPDEPQHQPGTTLSRAEIILPLEISNAFAIQMELSIHNAPSESGRLTFGVYQGAVRDTGYQAAIQAGSVPVLDLIRVRSGHSAIVESVRLDPGTVDGQPHTLEWRRDRNGQMELMLDGENLVSTSDRAFRGTFQGLSIANNGGDYGVRSISIHGIE